MTPSSCFKLYKKLDLYFQLFYNKVSILSLIYPFFDHFIEYWVSNIDLFNMAFYHLLMKQKEYDQWNDQQEFYSEDYFLPKKSAVTPHEYLVECYR